MYIDSITNIEGLDARLTPLPSQDVVRGTLVIECTEINDSTIGAAYGMLEALVGLHLVGITLRVS